MKTPIEHINWTASTYDALKRGGINFLEDLDDEKKMKNVELDMWGLDEIEPYIIQSC